MTTSTESGNRCNKGRVTAFVLAAFLAMWWAVAPALAQSSVRPPAGAVESSAPPAPPTSVRPPTGAATQLPPVADPTAGKGAIYDTQMWGKVRQGLQGTVSIPDKKAGVLVQSEGENWRNFRNGPLAKYGAWAMGGIIALLALFFLVRGRIRIEKGWSGRTILRFTTLERAGHWLLAVSFIILALTGLNILYGRYVLLPVIGKSAFASLTIAGKWAHNYVAFAFMAGLALTFIVWLRHNFPTRHDLVWLAKGGGMFSRGSHPPARKFNAGQKILFWLVMLGGLSISLSGISLLFPFQAPMFAKTFGVLNAFGFQLPTTLTPIEEMQYATSWHSIVALFLVCVIIGHIYIGTLGMEGAFDAMSTGEVDVNWAKEHHSIWAEEVLHPDRPAPDARPAPAE